MLLLQYTSHRQCTGRPYSDCSVHGYRYIALACTTIRRYHLPPLPLFQRTHAPLHGMCVCVRACVYVVWRCDHRLLKRLDCRFTQNICNRHRSLHFQVLSSDFVESLLIFVWWTRIVKRCLDASSSVRRREKLLSNNQSTDQSLGKYTFKTIVFLEYFVLVPTKSVADWNGERKDVVHGVNEFLGQVAPADFITQPAPLRNAFAETRFLREPSRPSFKLQTRKRRRNPFYRSTRFRQG